MSAQIYADALTFKEFFVNLGELDASADGKWARSSRILFCAASGMVCWMIFVALAETLASN
ncbi:hypothetical protein [Sphingomonas sp.]|uniref:hypothetical protein n=1 Tax=Sphingomonas sp. TaxID=28214 RepID=UPI000DB166CD|nr:hypothetical protein [Sphingomonas sp.]PZU10291.1 MAG: hypothetical protein DI605_06855 [Sphingomonas sp.]